MVFLGFFAFQAFSAEAGWLKPPPPPDSGQIAAFLARDTSQGIVTVQQWQGVVAKFDHGLEGKMVTVRDYLARRRQDLQYVSMVVSLETPRQMMKDIEVEVFHGTEMRRLGRKDLSWHRMTSRGNGIVTLDGILSFALVPGVMVGDRVRVVKKMEFRDVPGLPEIRLGRSEGPCMDAGYELRLPEDYRLAWDGSGSGFERGEVVYDSRSQGGKQVHCWSLQSAGQVAPESCRDSYPSYLLVPHIASTGNGQDAGMAVGGDWQAVGSAYLDMIEKVFVADEAIAAMAAECTRGTDDPDSQIDRIYTAVQQRCRYLGLFEGNEGIIPKPATEVLASGFGDCKGLGTLLISLLRASGFRAFPVLVRTRSLGPLEVSIPNMTQFNHFIVMVETEGGRVFLDGTMDSCPAGLVPIQDTLSPVLLLEPGAVGLVEIPAEARDPGTGLLTIEGSLDEQGILTFTSRYRVTGNLGVRWRNRLRSHEGAEGDEDVCKILLDQDQHFHAGEVRLEGRDDWRAPLIMEVEGRTTRPLPGDDHGFYLPRQLSGFLPIHDFKVACGDEIDLRSYPGLREEWSLVLPRNLSLAGTDTLVADGPGFRSRTTIWQEGGVLRLVREFRVDGESIAADQVRQVQQDLTALKKSDRGYLVLERS